MEAIDAREGASNATLKSMVSGFIQGTTYISGLSGGGWMLSSIVANDWAKVSDLEKNLWGPMFNAGLAAQSSNPRVSSDIASKSTEFNVSINDPWGRLISYQLLYGDDGGVSKTFSNYTNVPQFADHSMPLPILQALGLNPTDCMPGPEATQYEFTPYEFGSWDKGVAAFAPMKYIGTSFNNGQVSNVAKCVTGFDNSGFILGTSSLIFPGAAMCPTNGPQSNPAPSFLTNELMTSMMVASGTNTLDGLYPNPFYNLPSSDFVNTQTELRLGDGGLALQNNPLWSLIQPERNAAIILTVDNSADITDANDKNFPNGSEILTTYVQTIRAGIPFPVIPPVATFLSQNLTKKPTLFGCANPNVPTIIYLANAQHGSFPANQSTSTLQYTPDQSQAMIENGFNGMTQDKSTKWARCLGCFVAYDGNVKALRARPQVATQSSSSSTKMATTTVMVRGRPSACTFQAGRGSTCGSPVRPVVATQTPIVTAISNECQMCFDEYCFN